MTGSFANIVEALKRHDPDATQAELVQAAHTLVGYFETLLAIDQEQKEKCHDQNQRSEHPIR